MISGFSSLAFQVAFGLLATTASAATVMITVPGTANPYLSGLPDGTEASSGDVAPGQSPVLVTGIGISGGIDLTFAATGQVSLGTGLGPDPDGSAPISHFPGAQNGMSGVTMRRVSLLGVFLEDSRPDASPAPAGLDFATEASQNYTAISPLLQQVFFIGDGETDAGVTQTVSAPDGATRLFLGAMDGFGWFNNSGEFNVAVTGPDVVAAVPLPAGLPLMLGGLMLIGCCRLRRR